MGQGKSMEVLANVKTSESEDGFMALVDFIRESNRIEGILRDPTAAEVEAHRKLLALSDIDLDDIEEFVAIVAPGKPLRTGRGMDVRVGNHIAPPGGMQIVNDLAEILNDLLDGDPYEIHRRYETLHPFMDGNGRSGRAIWLWMMDKRGWGGRALGLGFLRAWYYQSLDARR